MTTEKICIHCFVSGKVQGVWFRASTQTEAEKLGLTGWAKNLPDGRVEVMACGEKAQVLALREWLKKGPPRAQVAEFYCDELPVQEFQGFEVL